VRERQIGPDDQARQVVLFLLTSTRRYFVRLQRQTVPDSLCHDIEGQSCALGEVARSKEIGEDSPANSCGEQQCMAFQGAYSGSEYAPGILSRDRVSRPVGARWRSPGGDHG